MKAYSLCGLEARAETLALAKEAVYATLARAMDTRFREGVIMCTDGTVLTTAGGLNEGSYAIHREGGRASSVSSPNLQFDDVCRLMAAHAWGSYGGVRWSSGIISTSLENGKADAHQEMHQRASFWLEAARTGFHPGHERAVVLREAERYRLLMHEGETLETGS